MSSYQAYFSTVDLGRLGCCLWRIGVNARGAWGALELGRVLHTFVEDVPFVEDVLPGGLDMALFEFGEQHAGQVLTACDCLSIFDRGTVRRSGLLKQMRILLGWWTVYFPNDWAAVSHYSPGVLVWFLLKHVSSLDFNRPRRDFSPLRASIASMAMIPWEQLFVQLEEYGVLGIVLGGFVPRRPVVGINSSGKCDRR